MGAGDTVLGGTFIQQLEVQAGDQSRVQRVTEVRGNRYSLVRGGIQSGGRGDTVWGEGVYSLGGRREDLLETRAGDQSRVQRVAEVRGNRYSLGVWGVQSGGGRTGIQQLEAQAGDQSRVQRVAEVRGNPYSLGAAVYSLGRTCIQQLEAQAGDQSRVQRVAELRGNQYSLPGVQLLKLMMSN